MTQAEYARYKGVGRSMVTKLKRDGRLVMTTDGKRVMVNESDARIKLTANLNNSFNESQATAARVVVDKAMEEKTFTELKKEVNAMQLDLETNNADELYKNARALREKSAALQAAAEYEKYMQSLVPKETIEKIIFERGRQFRDGLMTCSRRIAPEISGIESSKEIEEALTREFRALLEDFTKLPVIR